MNINLPTVLASGALSAASTALIMASSVSLQISSPGTTELGHTNISGNSLAGRFGANIAPTLARVQVEETGTLQGVRAQSNSGVAIFGKSTAATGLGAGGYFTSDSVGGRGMVGDALSSTGNTVGGLFYNRSTGGGVAVWGRAIGAGTATGVFGEVLSATGTALAASNSGSGNSIVAGTSDDSLKTTGNVPRHQYSAGAAPMVPVAYGQVDANGVIEDAGSGNWTVARPATGIYEISVTGFDPSEANATIIATAQENLNFQGVTSSSGTNGADFNIFSWTDASVAVNTDFAFVVYMGNSGLLPPEFRDPPALKKYKNDEEWARKDPRGYEAWRKRFVDYQLSKMSVQPYIPPKDQTDRP